MQTAVHDSEEHTCIFAGLRVHEVPDNLRIPVETEEER